ncbi:FAD-binding oxidoreductase, partial [Rhodoplanes sp. SY1]|uniref:FAD-binding oxidoreductase n=1 Tax=Rhodoplanes sp. SY1 TaxID=3166646 RepID=UPI0038B6B051
MSTKKQLLIDIFGPDAVFDDPDLLDAYAHDESFAESVKPQFVVRPKTTEQVQALVKLANTTRTPLVPVSSGAPHFHGDTVPSAAEAIIVDLSGMKGILRVDPRNRIAVIEPGVTFAELIPA